MIKRFGDFLSLIKFSHTIFALPFAAIGFAAGLKSVAFKVQPITGLWVLLCMIFARSSAMAFNRWADRHIDSRNARTSGREIPSGVISADMVLTLTIISAFLFMVCSWLINPLCFYLSPVALAVVFVYSYTKRFTPLSHLVLGAGLALAPVGAYLAVTGVFASLPVIIGLGVMTWVGGFDIIYSLQDEQFDRENNLKSIPAWLGTGKALIVAQVLHVLTSVFFFIPWWQGAFGAAYLAGWILFSSLLVYQHHIASSRDLSRINQAFFTANGMASIFFMAFALADLFLLK